MIKYLQRMKHKKGFTVLELIVVIAIIGVMTAVILFNADTKGSQIKAANSTAMDFFAAVQSAMTRYMCYEAPLSPTFRDDASTPYLKYYKKANGNYPFDASAASSSDDYPVDCQLFLEVHVENGNIEYVNCANSASAIYTQAANLSSELGRLLKLELEERVDYQTGYYYARIDCHPKYSSLGMFQSGDSVRVVYTAFSKDRINGSNTNNLTFSDRDYVLLNGNVCGVASYVYTSTNQPSASEAVPIGLSGTKLG